MHTTLGRARKAVLAVAAFAAVLLPASVADASAATGGFDTLAAGEALGLDITGVAVLQRTQSRTTGFVVLRGLEPGVTYAAHLHNQPCAFPGNPGGGHYMNVAGAGAAPPNELWFSTTADPTAGVTANRAGVAVARGSADWVARPEAQAVIIHAIPTGGTTAGGPKVACADLG
jgi:hypothetical protein